MDLLNEEVRTLPPLMSGGIAALPPAGGVPPRRIITGLPSDIVKQQRVGAQYGRLGDFPKSPVWYPLLLLHSILNPSFIYFPCFHYVWVHK
jgi:hypothetical protein